ncbi:unnamed protein product [Rotaria sp. Silwood1]|nr:unnamed protein product [Rotaria sp. Silwood1]
MYFADKTIKVSEVADVKVASKEVPTNDSRKNANTKNVDKLLDDRGIIREISATAITETRKLKTTVIFLYQKILICEIQ